MAGYGGRRVFRAPGWIWLAVGISTLLCVSGAVHMFVSGGSALTAWGLAGMSVVGVGGLVECAFTRVELQDDAIEVRTPWSRKLYTRAEIAGVEEAKGTAPALKLAGGEWAKMPEIIGGGFGNSVRAWLKAS